MRKLSQHDHSAVKLVALAHLLDFHSLGSVSTDDESNRRMPPADFRDYFHQQIGTFAVDESAQNDYLKS